LGFDVTLNSFSK